jgi:uncharacterized membrane protein YdbT with pleckstrin-like domain
MLRPNEYLKFEAHFSYKVFVMPTLLMSIGILIFLAVWSGVAGDADVYFLGKAYSLASILILTGILMFIPYIYRRTDNKLKIYAITNQRVYVRRGIINIKEKDIPLGKINDVQITRSLIQRLFNAGDISIQVGNDGSSMNIKDINRPREFRDMVISAIYEAAVEQEAKARQQQQQRRQQQRYYGNNSQQGYNNQGSYNQSYEQDSYDQGYDQNGYGYYNQDEDSNDDDEQDYYKNY